MIFSLILITKAFAQEDTTVAAIEPTTEGPTTINPRINGYCWSCGVKNNVTVSFMLNCSYADRCPNKIWVSVTSDLIKKFRILDHKIPLKTCTTDVLKKVFNKTV